MGAYIPGVIGGDHSITYPILKALSRKYDDIAVIHFDAHSDTYGPAYGYEFHHGTPFKHLVTENIIDASASIQIGLRGQLCSSKDYEFARAAGFKLVFAGPYLIVHSVILTAKNSEKVKYDLTKSYQGSLIKKDKGTIGPPHNMNKSDQIIMLLEDCDDKGPNRTKRMYTITCVKGDWVDYNLGTKFPVSFRGNAVLPDLIYGGVGTPKNPPKPVLLEVMLSCVWPTATRYPHLD